MFARGKAAIVLAVVILLLSLCLSAVAPSAHAHHRPRQWCPDGGRWCLTVRRSDGRRAFHLFHDGDRNVRYRLCVTPPDGTRACRRFRAEAALGVATDLVYWREHFPNKGAGNYKVVWKRRNGGRIGKVLGFHVR